MKYRFSFNAGSAFIMLSLSLVISSLSTANGEVLFITRCQEWGDVLDQEEAMGRIDFALRCEKDIRDSLDTGMPEEAKPQAIRCMAISMRVLATLPIQKNGLRQ